MTPFALKIFLEVPNWCPHTDTGKVDFSSITQLELHSVACHKYSLQNKCPSPLSVDR